MILQVKEFHNTIAREKYSKASAGCPKSMFYFMNEDSKGYPTTVKQKGWVVTTKTGSKYFKNRVSAISHVFNFVTMAVIGD